MNLFRGQLFLKEMIPFPNCMNEEQRDNLQALVDPFAKFMEVFFDLSNESNDYNMNNNF